jgi:hypothetical protein
VAVTVNANGLSVSHKGSNGFSIATVPDVCKTPTPGGPVPMPYPNVARSGDLADGTVTVTADGGNMIAIKGSHYRMSTGDEPGTLGGLTSNTFKKETDWITYSFDVKLEGANACRLTDKKFHNHKNTVDAMGDVEMAAVVAALKAIAQACDQHINDQWDQAHPRGPKHNDCWKSSGETMWDSKSRQEIDKPVQVKLGAMKEDCVQANTPPNDYMVWQQNFDKDGKPMSRPVKGGSRPDVLLTGPGGLKEVTGVVDLKFPCPSEQRKAGQWSAGQAERYRDMFKVEPVLVFP